MAKTKKRPAVKSTAAPRKLKQAQYKHFKLSKRIKPTGVKLTGGLRLFVRSIKLIFKNPRLLGGVLLVYAFLTILFVKGFSSVTNLTELKAAMEQFFEGELSQISTSLILFGFLVGSVSSPTTEVGGAYQGFLIVIGSLALIWALRQVLSGKAAKVKHAYYSGMYPLIPFVLVLAVIGLQILPALFGSTLFGLVVNEGLATTFIEQLLFGVLFFLLSVLSIYMVSSSIFALYIVALPDMTPLGALRSARDLVAHRRAIVIRRLLVLPVLLIITATVIMLPVLIYLTGVAEWLFFAISTLSLGVAHAYVYSLYRELLQ